MLDAARGTSLGSCLDLGMLAGAWSQAAQRVIAPVWVFSPMHAQRQCWPAG